MESIDDKINGLLTLLKKSQDSYFGGSVDYRLTSDEHWDMYDEYRRLKSLKKKLEEQSDKQ